VARLSDRETVDLRWSLPPLLTALVEDGHLAPNLAAGLIGVAEPAETWSWRLGDFVSAVFPRLAPATREIVANNLLQELDRQHLATPPQSTLDRLIAELRPQLEEPSPALARLAQLKFEADLEHAVEKKGTWALPDAEHFTVDGPQASGATSASGT
jgi:hypothetical protein